MEKGCSDDVLLVYCDCISYLQLRLLSAYGVGGLVAYGSVCRNLGWSWRYVK